MIKVQNGHVEVIGSIEEIMTDFTGITEALYHSFKKIGGEDFAMKSLAKCGQLAVMTPEEIEAERERMKKA